MKKDKPFHSIRKPHFLGDKKAFRDFLEKNMVYPPEALAKKIEGTAYVKCEISDRGKVLNAESVHPLGYGLDEESERLCRLMQFDDTTERGLKIKHKRTLRITFVLPKTKPLKMEKNARTAREKIMEGGDSCAWA